jgi:hypothetical protein
MEAVDYAPCQALRGGLQSCVPQDTSKSVVTMSSTASCASLGSGMSVAISSLASPDADAIEIGGEGGVEIVGGGRCLLRDECSDVGKCAVAG